MRKVFQGEIFSVWQWEQELYDGSTKIFEKISRSDSAFVVGVLPDKTLLLVWDEQPGRAIEGILTPAGGQIEEGETPQQAASREFFEEAGYKAGVLTPWFSYKPSSKVTFTVHFFIGKNAEKVAEPQKTAGERTQVRLFTFDEFLALGQNESLRDTHIRIMLLEAQIDSKKKEQLYKILYE